jgi:XRE family transcriptional regulator, fatty acid utilization regulator
VPGHQLTGNRIRDRRLDRGMRQTDLAAAVGISPSYLNLIEHNSRRIAGKLLLDIARALAVEPAHLTEGGEQVLIDALRAAAADRRATGLSPGLSPGPTPAMDPDLDRIEDFIGRFPGWAALVAAQARRISRLESQVAELSDRLTHDPELATSLHQVITAVTAIRSTAAILTGETEVDQDWQRRFHRNIHDDSVKLAESSRQLVSYLEAAGEARWTTGSPQEEVWRYLDAIDCHVAALEDDAAADPGQIIAAAALRLPGLAQPAAHDLLAGWLARYRADAQTMPLGPFGQAARDHDHDPSVLARMFAVPLAAVLRRLSTLPRGQDHPPMGLAICDSAGAILHMKRIPGFAPSRVGAGCPLWPLYQALGQPGRGIRSVVALPGDRGPRFLCHAIAGPRTEPGFDSQPLLESTLLVRPAPATDAAAPVGIACRICTRTDCPARREPSVVG